MSEDSSIEAQTAAKVAERRNKGGRPPNSQKVPTQEAASPGSIEAQTAAGDGEVAPIVVNAAPEPKAATKKRLFPVTMKRNYHPIEDFKIDGAEPTAEQRVKVPAGASIEMDIEEAKDIIAKGIAVRNDPIG